jgi:hypothetical protein
MWVMARDVIYSARLSVDWSSLELLYARAPVKFYVELLSVLSVSMLNVLADSRANRPLLGGFRLDWA